MLFLTYSWPTSNLSCTKHFCGGQISGWFLNTLCPRAFLKVEEPRNGEVNLPGGDSLFSENVVLGDKNLCFPFLEWIIVRGFPIKGISTVLPNTCSPPFPGIGSSAEKLPICLQVGFYCKHQGGTCPAPCPLLNPMSFIACCVLVSILWRGTIFTPL